jgi:hypothetical protein
MVQHKMPANIETGLAIRAVLGEIRCIGNGPQQLNPCDLVRPNYKAGSFDTRKGAVKSLSA